VLVSVSVTGLVEVVVVSVETVTVGTVVMSLLHVFVFVMVFLTVTVFVTVLTGCPKMPASGPSLIAHEEIEEQDVVFEIVIVTVVVGTLARLAQEEVVLGEF
jgi:hypothetical protein